MYYYSPSTKGFYHTDFNPTIPDDAIAISDTEHSELHEGLINGKQIVIVKSKAILVDAEPVITWKDIRGRRNNLLASSDYTQVLDFTGDRQAWAAYRQQLRDIPQTFTNPEDVIWPGKPNS